MTNYIYTIARISAIAGGVVLAVLALLMTVSITGGAIAKLGHSDWLMAKSPALATWIQDSGIRTIRGMYEILKLGVAFVIFAFLPITSFDRAHAVVDVFTDFLPLRLNQFLVTFWEVIFFIVLVLITWRLFGGMERLFDRHVVSQVLKIPEWWGFFIAFVQMIIATGVSGFVVWAQMYKLFTGRDDILPKTDGAVH